MAATQLFINVAASDISKALVRSPTDLTPVAFPKLVVGDGRSYELYFVDGQGGYAAFSGDGSYIPYIAIGLCGYPTGGTVVWTFGANSTAALAYNVSPAALQTALQALPSIGSGNILVGGVAGKYYTFTFAGTLANAPQAEITANFSQLTPASTVDITTIVPGTVSPPVSAVQLAALALNPITFADDWTLITNGWTGSLSARTVEILEAFAAEGGTLDEIFQVTVANADGVRTTYVKTPATIQCTIISPESFAGADKPLLATQAALNAAVLGLGNFTREALTSAVDGNTNVTRPASASRHHLARVSFSGSGVDRMVSLLTTNSPNPGDFIFLAILPTEAYAYRYRVYNATTGGTLLADIQATANQVPYLLAFAWSGSAWQLNMDLSIFLSKADNLAGLADVGEAKENLRVLFANIENPTADFTVAEADEGALFRVNASGGPVAATLPAANTVRPGFLVAVQKYDAGPQVVTTVPPTRTLTTGGETAILQSDGNDWNVVMAYDPLSTPPTVLEVIGNRLDLETAAAIRAEATAGGAVTTGTAWQVAYALGGVWDLIDGSNTDDGILYIRPDDYDGTTNARVWKLRSVPACGLSTSPVVSPDAEVTVSPVNPVTVVVAAVSGTAGSNELRIAAPPAGFPLGSCVRIRIALPATAAINLSVLDDETDAELVAFDSDDGGGSAQNAAIELYWTGTAWAVLSLAYPTP